MPVRPRGEQYRVITVMARPPDRAAPWGPGHHGDDPVLFAARPDRQGLVAQRKVGFTRNWRLTGSARVAVPTCRRKSAGRSVCCRSNRRGRSWLVAAWNWTRKAIGRTSAELGAQCWRPARGICRRPSFLDHGSHTDPATVDPDPDTLARELAAGRQFSATEPQQIPRAGRQHLGPQLAGDAPDGFLVQFQAATSQLRPRLFDRQQTDLPADFRLHVGTATLAEPISRQFRVKPTSFGTAALAGPAARRTIQGHHRDRQAPQEPHNQGAPFFSTGRNGTSAAAMILLTWSAVSGSSLALAKSPAT